MYLLIMAPEHKGIISKRAFIIESERQAKNQAKKMSIGGWALHDLVTVDSIMYKALELNTKRN